MNSYLVFREDRPDRPLLIDASTALEAVQSYAAIDVPSHIDCVVVARLKDIADDERKFSRKNGVWRPVVEETYPRSGKEAHARPLNQALHHPHSQTPTAVRRARNWIVVPMWMAIAIGGLLGAGAITFVKPMVSFVPEVFSILQNSLLVLLLVFALVACCLHWLANQLLIGAEWARMIWVVILCLGLASIPFSLPETLLLLHANFIFGTADLLLTLAICVINIIPLKLLLSRETVAWFRHMQSRGE